ncbi:hypothetical protein TRVL_07174 [Trypanosoma vivax]|nr:hypothetical protein TRVL_07174 [Trypanosoma vivax]
MRATFVLSIALSLRAPLSFTFVASVRFCAHHASPHVHVLSLLHFQPLHSITSLRIIMALLLISTAPCPHRRPDIFLSYAVPVHTNAHRTALSAVAHCSSRIGYSLYKLNALSRSSAPIAQPFHPNPPVPLFFSPWLTRRSCLQSCAKQCIEITSLLNFLAKPPLLLVFQARACIFVSPFPTHRSAKAAARRKPFSQQSVHTAPRLHSRVASPTLVCPQPPNKSFYPSQPNMLFTLPQAYSIVLTSPSPFPICMCLFCLHRVRRQVCNIRTPSQFLTAIMAEHLTFFSLLVACMAH